MSRRPPPRYESWEAADAAFTQFVGNLPLRRAQLRERIATTGGPTLDGALGSLNALNEWYAATALSGEPDGMDWWPSWLARGVPATNPIPELYGHGSPDDVTRLWELVSIYVADVMIPLIPHGRWVCFRTKNYREVANGRPVIDIGDRDFPGDAINIGNAGVPRTVSYRGTGHRLDVPSDTSWLSSALASTVERHERLRAAGTLRWQKAPTGPDAHRRTTKPDW